MGDQDNENSPQTKTHAAASIINALSNVFWPLFALIVFFSLLEPISQALSSQNLKIKVGDYELSIDNATQQESELLGSVIKDVQLLSKRLAKVDPSGATALDKIENINVSHLLWVEDTPENSAAIIEKIKNSGIDVSIAKSTKDALLAIEEQNFSMIITDMGRKETGLTEKNPRAGFVLLHRAQQQDASLPIVIFTSRASSIRGEAMNNGAVFVTDSSSEILRIVTGNR